MVTNIQRIELTGIRAEAKKNTENIEKEDSQRHRQRNNQRELREAPEAQGCLVNTQEE